MFYIVNGIPSYVSKCEGMQKEAESNVSAKSSYKIVECALPSLFILLSISDKAIKKE